ncbi:MAG: adenosine deaminase [Pseudomonadota bacterium]
MTDPPRPEDYTPVEKVELHQHVDGSIPAEVTWQLMIGNGLAPVGTFDEMRRLLVLQPEEQGSLLAYLDKFHYPLWVTQFYDNIADATFHIAETAWRHGVRGLELRYGPNIHTYAGLTLRQSITSVLAGLNRAERELQGMRCGLVVIAMRQYGPHIAKILARQAVSEAQYLHDRVGVVGFDIAGAERGNPPHLFREAFDIARLGRLGLTVHAGEEGPPAYIWQALDEIGAKRIGHGCSAVRDPELLRRLARDQVVVECCLTSNYQTNAAKRGEPHPIVRFLEAGVPVAICTDNTTVSDTDQDRECALAASQIGDDAVRQILAATPAYSFIRGLRLHRAPVAR